MIKNEAGRRSQILDGSISCFLVAAAIDTMAESDLCKSFFPLLVSEIWESTLVGGSLVATWSRKLRDHIFNHRHKTERKLEVEQSHKFPESTPAMHYIQLCVSPKSSLASSPHSAANWEPSVQMTRLWGHLKHHRVDINQTEMTKYKENQWTITYEDPQNEEPSVYFLKKIKGKNQKRSHRYWPSAWRQQLLCAHCKHF